MTLFRNLRHLAGSLCVVMLAASASHASTLGLMAVGETPEPSSVILLGMGAAGLFAYSWRKRRARA
jgi:hypothetical protein